VFESLFPKTVTNQYRGARIAKWVFVALTAMTIARSLAHMFLPDGGAQSIATIPLDAYSTAASAVVIGMFAQWGLTQWMFGLMYVLVLWRYQSLIPLMWLFVVFEWTVDSCWGLSSRLKPRAPRPVRLATWSSLCWRWSCLCFH
jgi:hypothetical protein